MPQRTQWHAIACLRDSSVELASSLSLEVVYDPLSDMTLDDEDGGDELGIDDGQ